jgi:hypothetical protein
MSRILFVVFILLVLSGPDCWAQSPPDQSAAPAHNESELAKQTQNPVASLISVPFQFNFNSGGGLQDQTFFNLNIQPVIPFKLTDNWNMIARTIVPVVGIPGPDSTYFSGVGDIQEQIFISPSKPGALIWGVGPLFSVPTATADPAETGSWAAGANFVALTMQGPWVLGALVNNLWTFSDSGDPTEVNTFLLQPFVNYNFGKGWAISSAPVITANWDAPSGQEWTVPVGIGIARTVVFNRRPISLAVQYYHNVERPDGAGANQIRFQVSLLYPKH